MTNLAIPLKRKTASKNGAGIRAGQTNFVIGTMTPLMAYMLFFALLPMIWALVLGFFDYSPAHAGGGFLGLGGANPFIGLDNYKAMFANTQPARVFRMAVGNTFLFAFLVLPLNLMITLPLAVLVESVNDHVKGLFRSIYFLPTISSSVAVAIMWGFIYNPQQGILNSLIKSIGLNPPRAWLTDPQAVVLGIPLAMIAVIIAYLWQDFGYNLVIFCSALQCIPGEIRDSARVDGANAWQEFWQITLPLLKPTTLLVCVMTMLSSFQVFVIFQVMTNGGPSNQTTPLVMSIYLNAFKYQNMGWAAAISFVLFLIIMSVTAIQFRVLRTDWEY